MKRYNHLVNALVPVADAFAGTKYTDIINMKDWNHIQFVIQKAAGAVGTATITVEACDNVTPSNVSAVPFKYQACTTGDTFGALTTAEATGFATTAGANQMYKIEVDADALVASGYGYIRLKSVEVVVGAVLGGIIGVLTEPRYGREIPDSAIV